VLLIAAGGAAGWAVHRFTAGSSPQEHAEAGEEGAPAVAPGDMNVKVKTAAATAGDLPIVVDAVGIVRAERSASCTISSRAYGRVSEVAVAAGQTLKKGDLIIRFEPDPMRAVVAEKRAAKQLAENQLAEFDKVGRERQIVELTTAVRNASAELRLAEAQVDRLTPLAKEKLVADKAFAEATQAAEKAKQDRDRAAQALAAYETTGAALQRNSLETTRAAAVSALEDAEAVLGAADVHATEEAQVVAINVRRGDRLEAGAPIGSLLCTQARFVVFGVTPAVARLVHANAPATWLDVDGMPMAGAVNRVVAEVNGATGLVDVVVQPDQGGPDTPPGLIVRGEIEIDRKKGAVLVPASAIVRSADHQVVAVVADDVAKIVPVEVLGRHGDVVAVQGAVKAGDRVVIEGAYNLPEGARVAEDADESRASESKPGERGK